MYTKDSFKDKCWNSLLHPCCSPAFNKASPANSLSLLFSSMTSKLDWPASFHWLPECVWRGSEFTWTRAPLHWGWVMRTFSITESNIWVNLINIKETSKSSISGFRPLIVETVRQRSLWFGGTQSVTSCKKSILTCSEQGEAHPLLWHAILNDPFGV